MTHLLLKRPQCAANDPAPAGADTRCPSHDTTRYKLLLGGETVTVALCERHAAELRADEFRSAA